MNRIKELLAQIGLEPERIEMFNMSAAMAGEFVARAAALTEKIAALGPSPLRSGNGRRTQPDPAEEANHAQDA